MKHSKPILPGDIIHILDMSHTDAIKEMAERIRRLEIEIFGHWIEVKANNDYPHEHDGDSSSDS